MGGRPLAMVDVICNSDDETTRELCRGMKDNAARFNVPLVGGHTSHNAGETSFSLSILGRAKCLITSFDAQPGDQLILAYNPHGIWLDSFGFWNSNNTRSDKQLQEDLELLPYVAEKSLSIAGKDVSMAGIIGTSLMLAEASRVGLQIDLDGIIVPEGISMSRWLLAFLSYGFLLAVKRQNVASLSRLFSARNLAALNIGSFESGSQLRISQGKEEICLWDWYEESFTGFQKP
jgi:selenophosphate synthetase-related protein